MTEKEKNKLFYFQIQAVKTTSDSGLIRFIEISERRAMITIGKEMAMLDVGQIDRAIYALAAIRNKLKEKGAGEDKNVQ